MTPIRELIENIQNDVREKDLTPHRASELLIYLSSLLGNANEELKVAQMDYNKKLAESLNEHKTVAKARLFSETTPEFESFLEAKGTKELVMQLISSMKYQVKVKLEEYHESRY